MSKPEISAEILLEFWKKKRAGWCTFLPEDVPLNPLRWGWVFFISCLQNNFRKNPQVESKFCRSLLTTKFVDVAPIGVVINIWNLSWPCNPIWDKWNGSSQTPCPCRTCPTKIWRPPSPCPTCPTKIWRPPSPCPTCPTYSNLSRLVPFGCTTCPFPTLFSEVFFWVSHCHSIFRKKNLNEKFVSKYYHVGEGTSNKYTTNKFPRKNRR